jgi:predicted Zn finger-like uncharacterized protein
MTLFRVVPDQLRISDGWVRCGQCDEVFDGNLHLQDGPAQTHVPVDPLPETATAPIQEPDSSSQAYDWGDVMDEPEPKLDPDPLSSENQDVPVWHAELDVVPEPPLQALDSAPDADFSPSDQPAPTFMQAAAQPELDAPQSRLRLILLALLLGVLLLLQLVWQERDVMAANYPISKPVLQSLCSLMGCEISAPKQIDAVQIESSAYAKVRPDVYQLQFTLRNAASTELALPAVELTLTDVMEQPVLRKVFLSDSFGLSQGSLPAAGDVSVSIPVTLEAAGLGDRIAGYRLLAFYP